MTTDARSVSHCLCYQMMGGIARLLLSRPSVALTLNPENKAVRESGRRTTKYLLLLMTESLANPIFAVP